MIEDVIKIAPQVQAYLEEKQTYMPYLMHADAPNIQRKEFSTDGYGFRTTYTKDEKVLSFDDFWTDLYDGRRGIILGNSTAFGVGATSDYAAFVSQLNKQSQVTWFNMAHRMCQSTQEMLTYILFSQNKPVESVVMISGVNNFDMSYRWHGGQSSVLPPFYSQGVYYYTLSRENEFARRSGSFSSKLLRVLYGLKCLLGEKCQENIFFSKHVQNLWFSESKKFKTLLHEKNFLQRSLDTMRRDLATVNELVVNRGGEFLYVIQPIAHWSEKPLSIEEKQLFDVIAKKRSREWNAIEERLSEYETSYRYKVRAVCDELGVKCFDANEAAFARSDEWLFLDRYHLTDCGQKMLAEYILKIGGV